MQTIREMDEAGLDLQLLCRGCAHQGKIDSIIWQLFDAKGWDGALAGAGARFRCTSCGGHDIEIQPIERPPPPANAGEQLVVSIFHRSRSAGKKARRGQSSYCGGFPERYNQWWRWTED